MSLSDGVRSSHTSLMPPPGKGTMNLTVRVGNALCAATEVATSAAKIAATHAATMLLIAVPSRCDEGSQPPSRLIASAEGRLTLAQAGKLPHARATWILVGADIGIDEIRPARSECGAQRLGKIGRAVDVDARDAGRARHRGKVRVVGCARVGMAEIGRKLAAAEIAALQSTDRGIGEVVPYHPDDRQIVFDRGTQHARMHEEGAVAAYRNARPLGCGELRAQDAGDAESHRAETHGSDERVRPPRIAELDQPVVVDADVTHQYGVLRQHLVDLMGGALRMDRRGVVGKSRRDERVPFAAIALDGVEPFRARRGRVCKPVARLELR